MKWLDYREKLGIGFNDEQKFKMLKNKIKNYIFEIDDMQNYMYDYMPYFMMVGEEYDFAYGVPYSARESMDLCENMNDLIAKCIAFYNSLTDKLKKVKLEFLKFFKESLADLRIDYDIIKDEDGLFIFPKGAKELDDALVSEPLEWLNEYPLTKLAWISALNEYSNMKNANDVADKFRKALERFFQEFFGSDKSIENLVSTYGNFMKDKNVPAELSNNLIKVLELYNSFMNSYAKHHDKTSKDVLEYIMYQTGSLIRFMITLTTK